MRVLCVADHVDPLVYTSTIKERMNDVDLVLSAGDLPMEYHGFIVSCLNKPLLFVFGNHNLKRMKYFVKRREPSYGWDDDPYHLQRFGSIHVGGKVVLRKGLIVAGLGGSMLYNKGPNQFTDFQMTMRALRLIPKLLWNRVFHGRYVDILLTHAPPREINDRPDRCHTGFGVFLWLMRTFKPRYLVHGHVHLYDLNARRRARYRETIVINAYNHVLLDVEVNDESRPAHSTASER
jgi:uncharacterized protein